MKSVSWLSAPCSFIPPRSPCWWPECSKNILLYWSHNIQSELNYYFLSCP